ncbi:undecaprenyl-diphosphate phosphatase [Blattabacterium cuenoti]|uniref:undecaprenyl-diphosphate phosphatase n=1 Tax=Blattabacterium cuenoti TaxID=1653831 RepID=UPI00163D08D8|nr:undecaprenyl-diphosphate phosphatase [Blattabacterium cuenoti]
MNYIQSIVLGIIEGITEFFPISSTGHMIIIAYIMGILDNSITKLFLVFIQCGSILSVIFLYRKKLLTQNYDFYIKICIASFPVLITGLFFYEKINILLNNPVIVFLSFIMGGIFILKSENFYKNFSNKKKNNITYYRALIIGFFQCLSLIPGISRSATTIVAGLLQNIKRKDSIEFSFFLSVPIISIATIKKVFDFYIKSDLLLFNIKNIRILLLGNITAFVTSMIAIKYLMNYLRNNDFKLFGYYRIIIGIFFFITHYFIKIY